MEIKLTHCTREFFGSYDTEQEFDILEDPNETNERKFKSLHKLAMRLAGRTAGVCYMKDDYFDEKINNTETAVKRANNIISSHHSPFDHFHIGLEISGIPKMCAMILNSVQWYNTSEKSARYTVMKSDDEEETAIYEKWINIIKDLIEKKYPGKFDEKKRTKLAQENARYLISVFTPTSMIYTTTFREMGYMISWFDKLCDTMADTDFNHKIKDGLLPIIDVFKSIVLDESGNNLVDIKDGKFDFLKIQTTKNYTEPIKWADDEIFGEVYRTKYKASFACLAQLQRHRTITYQMLFDGTDYPNKRYYYVPPIIEKAEDICIITGGHLNALVVEWCNDMDKLADRYPQGTVVNVIERGTAERFLLKAKERLCGRAQLEIQRVTEKTLSSFYHKIKDDGVTDPEIISGFEKFIKDGGTTTSVTTKCGSGCICNEPCEWGATAISRLI